MSGVGGAGSAAAVNNQLAVGGHNGVDLETLFMSLGAERANTLDSVIQGHAADMKKRNDEIGELNQALQELRSAQKDSDGLVKLDQNTNAIKTLNKHGVSYPNSDSDNTYGKEEMQSMIENVKTAIDSKSSSSQLDMIKMQGLINKRNQTVEMLTNLVQKFAKTKDSIIGNMR